MSYEQATRKRKKTVTIKRSAVESFFKHIALGGVGFLISSVSIFGEIAPFAFGALASLSMRDKAGGRIGLLCVAGGYFAKGIVGVVQLSACMIVFILIRGLSSKKTGTLACAVSACAGCALTGVVLAYIANMDVIHYIYALGEGVIAFASCFIFQLGFSCMLRLFESGKRSSVELLSLYLCAALACAGIGGIFTLGWNIALGMSAFLLLVCIYYVGQAEAAVMSCVFGVVFAVALNMGFGVVGMLSVSAVIASLVSRFDKYAVSLVYAAAVSVCSYILESDTIASDILSVLIGAALFIAAGNLVFDKKHMKAKSSDDKVFLTGQAANRILQTEIELQKSMIKEISKNITEYEQKEIKNPSKEIAKQLASDICRNCSRYASCWKYDSERTYYAVKDVVSAYLSDDNVSYDNIPGEFESICVQAPIMFKTMSIMLDAYRVKQNHNIKNNKFKRLMSEQFKHLARVLDKMYLQLSKGLLVDTEESSYAYESVLAGGVNIESLVVMEDFYKKQKVFVTSGRSLSSEESKNDIPNILSEALKRNISYDYEMNVNGERGSYSYCYAEEYKYKLAVGVRGCTKENSETSGDGVSNIILSNGLHLLALCDGMGSGKNANIQSTRVLNMFEELLNAGFDEDSAIQTVNSILVLDDNEEIFVALDLFLFDLNKGLGEFVKAGAAPTFLRRGKELVKLEMDTLPLGILEEIHVKKSTKSFKRGDYLYFMSDGFFDSYNTEDIIIKQRILEYEYRNPQKIADALFYDALSATGGEAIDDITIVVARIR